MVKKYLKEDKRLLSKEKKEIEAIFKYEKNGKALLNNQNTVSRI